MKKFLGLSFFVMALAKADGVVNPEMVGAFYADDETTAATKVLRRQLLLALPECTLVDVPTLEGHLFAAAAVRNGAILRHNKTYLVSKYVGCGSNINGIVRSIRRSVTAKILVNVIHHTDGTIEEIPAKVTLVNISDDPSEATLN